VRGELRASAAKRGGVGKPESVIADAERLPAATARSPFAPPAASRKPETH